MAKLVGHVRDGGARGEKIGRVSVAKVVEAELGKTRYAEERAEPLGQSRGVPASEGKTHGDGSWPVIKA